MKKMVALVGEAGSGKDTLLSLLVETYPTFYKRKISYTTRKKRPGEKEGQHYHFVKHEEFFKMVWEDVLLEAVEFNNEMYGTLLDDLDDNKINIGIFDPNGLDILLKEAEVDLLTVYIEVSDKERLRRQLHRSKTVDELYERHMVDRALFDGIKNRPSVVVLNNEVANKKYSMEQLHALIKKHFRK